MPNEVCPLQMYVCKWDSMSHRLCLHWLWGLQFGSSLAPAIVGYNAAPWITSPLLSPQARRSVLPEDYMDFCFHTAV